MNFCFTHYMKLYILPQTLHGGETVKYKKKNVVMIYINPFRKFKDLRKHFNSIIIALPLAHNHIITELYYIIVCISVITCIV